MKLLNRWKYLVTMYINPHWYWRMPNATLKENYNMLNIKRTHLVYARNLFLYKYMYKYIQRKEKQEQSKSICVYGFTSTYPTLSKSRLIKTLRRQKLFFQTYTYFIYEPDIIVIKWLRNRTGNISISQKWFVIIWRKIYIYIFFPETPRILIRQAGLTNCERSRQSPNRTFGIQIQVWRNAHSSGTIRLLWG